MKKKGSKREKKELGYEVSSAAQGVGGQVQCLENTILLLESNNKII